jgi:ferredoxin
MAGELGRGLLARMLGATPANAAPAKPDDTSENPDAAINLWGPIVEPEPAADGDLGLLGDEAPLWRPAVTPAKPSAPVTATSEPPPEAARRPVAVVMARLCLNAWSADSCAYCLWQCPEAGALTVGPRGVPVVDPQRCTACGLCVPACKAMPQAIRIA